MHYLLMATGESGKLCPLTAVVPAPMIPILNRPVMTYSLELFARRGPARILVALYEQSAMIEKYFGDGSRWNVKLDYLLQRQPLGTAGTLKRAEQLLKGTVCVLPADALLDLDIDAAIRYHRNHGGVATAILCRSGDIGSGHNDHDNTDKGDKFAGKRQTSDSFKANMVQLTGAFILEPEVLALIPGGEKGDIATDLLPTLIEEGHAVYCYTCCGYWNALTSFEALQEAQSAMLASLNGGEPVNGQPPIRYPFQDGRQIAPGIWCGTHTFIHPTAQLTAPLYIGSDCRIGPETEIGPQTVLGSHSVVDEGATVRESIVLHHTYVGRLVDVQQRIVAQNLLIDRVTESSLPITDPFLLGEVNPRSTKLFWRTLFDRFVAALLIGLLSPLIVSIALLLWFTSGLPPFCVVQRFGVKPRWLAQELSEPSQLRLLRFRQHDRQQRILPVGAWVESWQLQRLPELFSVLRGEMALVGVKPLTEEERCQITEEWQLVRYQIAAGFTGLWYLQTTRDTPFDSLCMADSYQAATDRWQQALTYLWQTPRVWMQTIRRNPEQRQLANPSEVRSQPVAQ